MTFDWSQHTPPTGDGADFAPWFNMKNEGDAISGTVARVYEFTPKKGPNAGVTKPVIDIETSSGVYAVSIEHVGLVREMVRLAPQVGQWVSIERGRKHIPAGSENPVVDWIVDVRDDADGEVPAPPIVAPPATRRLA